MPIRHGLLALLARGPMHGYQLRAEFEAATGATWPLNIGQVYTTLVRLERDGLVEPVGESDGRAASPTGSPTPAGPRSRSGSTTPVARETGRATSWRSSSRWRSPRPASTSAQVVQAQRTATMRTLQELHAAQGERRPRWPTPPGCSCSTR